MLTVHSWIAQITKAFPPPLIPGQIKTQYSLNPAIKSAISPRNLIPKAFVHPRRLSNITYHQSYHSTILASTEIKFPKDRRNSLPMYWNLHCPSTARMCRGWNRLALRARCSRIHVLSPSPLIRSSLRRSSSPKKKIGIKFPTAYEPLPVRWESIRSFHHWSLDHPKFTFIASGIHDAAISRWRIFSDDILMKKKKGLPGK